MVCVVGISCLIQNFYSLNFEFLVLALKCALILRPGFVQGVQYIMRNLGFVCLIE